jgi:uncharacterized protein with FMN-binding domain
MRKTMAILIIVTLLGILAAYEVPAGSKKTVSTNTQLAPASTSSSNTPAASSSGSSSTTNTSSSTSTYKDGTYTGSTASNQYEDIQVAITVSNGKITNVTTPTVNSDSNHSAQINSDAIPQLDQQVLSSQSAQIDGVSGASYTTQSYTQSLQAAIDQAKV